jgi:hypothetical protein
MAGYVEALSAKLLEDEFALDLYLTVVLIVLFVVCAATCSLLGMDREFGRKRRVRVLLYKGAFHDQCRNICPTRVLVCVSLRKRPLELSFQHRSYRLLLTSYPRPPLPIRLADESRRVERVNMVAL